MLKVFRDNAARVRKCQLRKLERNAMLRLVLTILCLIPLEASRHNDATKEYIQKIWAVKSFSSAPKIREN
jgi:hypothetical protein